MYYHVANIHYKNTIQNMADNFLAKPKPKKPTSRRLALHYINYAGYSTDNITTHITGWLLTV